MPAAGLDLASVHTRLLEAYTFTADYYTVSGYMQGCYAVTAHEVQRE